MRFNWKSNVVFSPVRRPTRVFRLRGGAVYEDALWSLINHREFVWMP